MLIFLLYCQYIARGKCSLFSSYNESMVGNKLEETRRHSDLQIFDLSTVIAATEDFSHANKLGEGGFGSVYKVKLQLKFLM